MHASRPLVTVAIPTYNRADHFLPRCLESVVQQDYAPLEIVVSDNCSEDHTEEIVASFNHPGLRYIRHETNLGPYRNFEACVDAAHGDYFMLLQDDDLIDSDFVSTCMQAVDYRTDVGFVRTGTRIIDHAESVVSEKRNRARDVSGAEYLRDWLQGRSAWYLCSTLFNTEKLRLVGGFTSENKLAVDGAVFTKMALHFEGVDVPDVKASFREHEQEITFNVDIRRWTKEYVLLLESLEQMLPAHEKSDLLRETEHFFSTLTYRFADGIASPLQRLQAYWVVFRAFGYNYPPPKLVQMLKPILPLSAWSRLKKASRRLQVS